MMSPHPTPHHREALPASLPSPLRIIFMGTPAFSVPCLEALLAQPGLVQIIGVVTQPDRPAGRGNKYTPSPVKVVAEAHGLPVLQPERLRKDEDTLAWIDAQQADAIVTIAFGQILPTRVLQASRLGTINVHASLLPAYRGANPIQWALLNGDSHTGLTTMLSDEGVDTGPMLLTQTLPIEATDTTASLSERLAALAGGLLLRSLVQLHEGSLTPCPQPMEGITLAPKLSKEASLMDWSLPAPVVERTIRALTPWPGAVGLLAHSPETTTTETALRLKLHLAHVEPAFNDEQAEASEATEVSTAPVGSLVSGSKKSVLVRCGEGSVLRLERVQPPSKGVMQASDWLRGLLANQPDAAQPPYFITH
jgi:methionyl-tRNA formyltransferase